jgi:hypothetical protein
MVPSMKRVEYYKKGIINTPGEEPIKHESESGRIGISFSIVILMHWFAEFALYHYFAEMRTVFSPRQDSCLHPAALRGNCWT